MLGTHEVVVTLIAYGYYETEYRFFIKVNLQEIEEIIEVEEDEEEVFEFDFQKESA